MLLVFCPNDDAATAANVPIARHLASSPPGKLLEGTDAVRGNLTRCFENDAYKGLVFMGHGSKNSVAEQGGGDALLVADFDYYKPRPALAYCCFSAHMGSHAAMKGRAWWGYDNVMQPPPLDVIDKDDIADIFRYFAHRYWNSTDETSVLRLISEVKEQCDSVLDKYESRGESVMSCSMFFRHVWSRLRVWLPYSKTAIAHQEVFGGELDFSEDH